MAKQYQPVEVNSFVKGLITEASPLTFPENASLDERNFVLNKDGTRNRRLGIAEEFNVKPVPTKSEFKDKNSFLTSFLWEGPGGDYDKTFLVLQDGESIKVFDREAQAISAALLYEFTPISFRVGKQYSFASVDGTLVFVTGGKRVYKLEYIKEEFKISSFKLKVRDVFGVADGLFDGMNVTKRPEETTYAHTYNLRNQSWAIPRKIWVEESPVDPISKFYTDTSYGGKKGKYPSNVDTVNQALYADTNDSDDRTTKRFFPPDMITNPIGSTASPKGYFIIDALDRGATRKREVDKLYGEYGQLKHPIVRLPKDMTNDGATAVTEYGGRLWYGGFGSTVDDGDDRSPQLSSYLLFSQLVKDPSNFYSCYQAADPTSVDDSTLVDTDGGFIRIDEAVNIKKLVTLGRKLIVLADNGIWSVEGGNDYGFTATNYMIHKLTDKGLLGTSSVVVVDQTLFYWSESGLLYLAASQVGDLQVQNLTNTTIQTIYSGIDYEERTRASGAYDKYEQKVRWVYGGNKELIFDLNLQAFYLNEFNNSKEVRSIFSVPAYQNGFSRDGVTVGGEPVTVKEEDSYEGPEDITITISARLNSLREMKYTIVDEENGLSFGAMSDVKFRDWDMYDSEAYLLTGYLTGGETQRKKNVPYLTLHFKRTETGLDENYELQGESSCMVRAAWEWTNSANSNRWGREFQGYRYRRHFIPSTPSEGFDTGFDTVVTKNKLRGKGRALSLQFRTQPEKDCHLLGWSMILGVNANV